MGKIQKASSPPPPPSFFSLSQSQELEMVWIRHVILRALVSSHRKRKSSPPSRTCSFRTRILGKKNILSCQFLLNVYAKEPVLEFSREIITKGQLGGQQLDKGIQQNCCHMALSLMFYGNRVKFWLSLANPSDPVPFLVARASSSEEGLSKPAVSTPQRGSIP